MADDQPWAHEMYDLLTKKHGVTQISYVPDAGHRVMIERALADDSVHAVSLTTEEEGVAMSAGAWLGGEKSILLMQSSGAGNCVNMFALVKGGQFPFVTLVTMRGEFGEMNPWQVPMGTAVQPVVEAMGLHCLRAESPEEVVPTVQAAFNMAYKSNQGVAVLLTQKLIGAKAF